MTRWWSCYVTATRFALVEQGRNRLALVLLTLFIPLWVYLGSRVAPANLVPFYARPAGQTIGIDARTLAQLMGALQAIALIVGFMMFIATGRSAPFDRRLVQAGYSRLALVSAKLTALVFIAVAVAVYTTAWMQLYWRAHQIVLLAASLFLGALIYGGIGIMLAAILRSELAGMFLLIMTSSLDVSLQHPILNTAAASPALRGLPAYGALQSAVTAARLDLVPWSYLGLGLCWAAATAATGITAFVVRTRSRRPPTPARASQPSSL